MCERKKEMFESILLEVKITLAEQLALMMTSTPSTLYALEKYMEESLEHILEQSLQKLH